MTQPELGDGTPPATLHARHGEPFNRKRDGKRLDGQPADVFRLMRDGNWRSLSTIAKDTGHPEASVSARLRDLRRDGYTVERAHIAKGLWLYRVGV